MLLACAHVILMVHQYIKVQLRWGSLSYPRQSYGKTHVRHTVARMVCTANFNPVYPCILICSVLSLIIGLGNGLYIWYQGAYLCTVCTIRYLCAVFYSAMIVIRPTGHRIHILVFKFVRFLHETIGAYPSWQGILYYALWPSQSLPNPLKMTDSGHLLT